MVGGPLTEMQQQYLTRIRLSQHHLLGIVTDLLDYSRIEAAQVTYEIAPILVHKMVDEVLPLVETQAAAKKITFEHGRCQPDIVARADRQKAEQITTNLLSNAVKFTPANGRVSIACAKDGDRVLITVRDTGPGIPLDKQESIFEPFVQLGRSLTNQREGTGLGLAISRDMARAMGGDVLVQSDGRMGSTFTFALPSDV